MPHITGVSHVSFSVADLVRATWFWTEVMGCEVVMEESDFCLCVEPATRLPISLKTHDGSVTGSFDETRVGLDHLALAVADRAELEAWRKWLEVQQVRHSRIVETDSGYHLNVRAPDDIAVELFVAKPEVSAALGLGR